MRRREWRFPGGSENIFGEGIHVPQEEEFSSTPVHGAVGFEGYSWPSGTARHSGIAGSFFSSAVPLQKSGFLQMGVLVVLTPPP